jgi:hypothetical protein
LGLPAVSCLLIRVRTSSSLSPFGLLRGAHNDRSANRLPVRRMPRVSRQKCLSPSILPGKASRVVKIRPSGGEGDRTTAKVENWGKTNGL